jgi:hypothetical protein
MCVIFKINKKLSQLEHWKADDIKSIIKQVCDELELGFGKVGQPTFLILHSSLLAFLNAVVTMQQPVPNPRHC